MCDFMSKSLEYMWLSMVAHHAYFAALVWYDGVCDEACLNVWLGFVMWWMSLCHDYINARVVYVWFGFLCFMDEYVCVLG